jgi:hypothetical protein
VLLTGGSSTRHEQVVVSSSTGTERLPRPQTARLADPIKPFRQFLEKTGAAETYFNARYTNANVRCLDHADIICTITNGKKN